jgi:MYXO-CTERM domain-containing protein
MGKLFNLLEPNSASLAISLTDVRSSTNDGPVSGFAVVGNALQTFTADATAAIAAEPFGGQQELPEPSGFTLAILAGLAVLRFRRRAGSS